MTVLAIGLTTLDVALAPVTALPTGEKAQPVDAVEAEPAGTAAGFAFVAARLGLPVRLAGAVGDDRIGRFVRCSLEEEGVDTSLLTVLPDARTSTTVLAIDPEGRRPRFHARGASALAGVDADLTAAAGQARFVHWAGFGAPGLEARAAEVLGAARAGGATITCDLISPRDNAREVLAEVLPFVSYFMPSAEEALHLSGCDTVEAAADRFVAGGAQACIVKDGPAGSYLALPGERLRLPAHDVRPVDTTSCGDSFCAGFVAGLASGRTPVEAARFATTVAALVAGALGTLGRLESFAAVERAMTEIPLRRTP